MDKKEKLKKMWYEFIQKEKEEEILAILEFLEDNPKAFDSLTQGLPEKLKGL